MYFYYLVLCALVTALIILSCSFVFLIFYYQTKRKLHEVRPDISGLQWWILGEANEAIALGPPFFTVIEGPPLFENAACSFILWYFTWFHEPQKLSKVFSK